MNKRKVSMIQKIKTMIVVAIMPFMLAAPALVLVPAVANAACSGIAENVTKGVNDSVEGGKAGQQCGSTQGGIQDSSIGDIAKKIVTLFSQIVGFVSVVFIIYGGFRYITSGGDSTKVGNAKNTIIYALIGLIIVALAQAIIAFTLNTSANVVK